MVFLSASGTMFSIVNGVGRSNCNLHFHASHASWVDSKLQEKFLESVKKDDNKGLQKVLKKKGVDVNFMFRFDNYTEKMTALHFAAKYGKVQMALILLGNRQVNVDLKTQFDEATPLHFACKRQDANDSFAVADALVKCGADVNVFDHWKKTPLIWAAEVGNVDVVRVLIQNGANLDHTYSVDELPCFSQQSLVCDMLTKDPYFGNSALIQACRYLHKDIVRELLFNGANVNVVNRNKSSALHAAADMFSLQRGRSKVVWHAGNADIVQLLINAGADVNALDIGGFTPLGRSLLALFEIEALQVPMTGKLPCYLASLQIAQLLVRAGCPVITEQTSSNDITLLNRLLLAGDFIVKCEYTEVIEEYKKLVRMLVTTGAPLAVADVEIAASLNLHDLTDFVLAYLDKPLPLKFLSVVAIRKSTPFCPLERHLQKLQLPELLKKLVCLEIS